VLGGSLNPGRVFVPLRKKQIRMTTLSITFDNPELLSALQQLVSHLDGVKGVMISRDDMEIPNLETRAAMNELQAGKGTRCKNADELFEKLNS
jgi:hypothetical protein